MPATLHSRAISWHGGLTCRVDPQGLKYQWPGFLGDFLRSLDFVSGGVSSVVSPHCLFSYSDLKPLYTNMLVTLMAPPAFVACAFCVLVGLQCKSSKDSGAGFFSAGFLPKLKSRLRTVSIFIVFIFQPAGSSPSPSLFLPSPSLIRPHYPFN